MKRNQIITISIVILSIFCACNSRSAKVEVIQEEVIEDNIVKCTPFFGQFIKVC